MNQWDNRVIVEVREVYGTLKAYPVNDQAKRLAELAGTKTLTGRAMRLASDMGLIVVEQYGRDWGVV